MKRLKLAIIFVVSLFVIYYLMPSPVSAALPGCEAEGGSCRYSCPSGWTEDHSSYCPGYLRKTCCSPPPVCYGHNDQPFYCQRGSVYYCNDCTEVQYTTHGRWYCSADYSSSYDSSTDANYNCMYIPGIVVDPNTHVLSGPKVCPKGKHLNCPSGGIVANAVCVENIGPVACTSGPPAGSGPVYDITGNVFLDDGAGGGTARNGVRDGGEAAYLGATLRLSGDASASKTSNGSGNYAFNNYPAGTYAVTITIPSGYVNTSTIKLTANISNANRTGINFGIVNIYSISGSVFNDTSKDTYKNGSETKDWSDLISITSTGGTVTVDSAVGAGTYTVSNLFAGTYTVSYTSPLPSTPTQYFMIYPLNGPPPFFSLTVGPNCISRVNLTAGHRCSNGNLSNANFAISNSIPWMQGYGLNMRLDEGFDDKIPASPLYPPYASVADTDSGAVYPIATPTPVIVVPAQTLLATDANGNTHTGFAVGTQYRIHVSNTYQLSSSLHYDAQWSDNGGAQNCYCIQAGTLFLNGASSPRSTPDVYNSTHNYDIYWTANSTSLNIKINDSNYSDNSGSLIYTIYGT